MKKRFTLLVLLIALISSLSYGQKSSRNPYSNNKIPKKRINVAIPGHEPLTDKETQSQNATQLG